MTPFLRKQKGPTMGHPTLVLFSILIPIRTLSNHCHPVPLTTIHDHPTSSIIHYCPLLSNHLAMKYHINLSHPQNSKSLNKSYPYLVKIIVTYQPINRFSHFSNLPKPLLKATHTRALEVSRWSIRPARWNLRRRKFPESDTWLTYLTCNII